MNTTLLQILLTVWINGQPVEYRLPELYPALEDGAKCHAVADKLKATSLPGVILKAECVPATSWGA